MRLWNCLVLILVASDAAAQVLTSTGKITGLVVAAADSTTLAAATVDLVGSDRYTTTNAQGTFAFDSVAIGMQHIRVRRLGYVLATATVDVGADQSSFVLIRLTRLPRELARVDIRGRRVVVPRHLQEAVERADRNHGTLFTADDIATLNPIQTKWLLDRIPGVHVRDLGVTFERCQGNLAAALTSFNKRTAAKVLVYIDGNRATGVAYGLDTPFSPEDAEQVLNSISPSSIALMEVYSGVARIPAEWFADACAVIVIWTKRY